MKSGALLDLQIPNHPRKAGPVKAEKFCGLALISFAALQSALDQGLFVELENFWQRCSPQVLRHAFCQIFSTAGGGGGRGALSERSGEAQHFTFGEHKGPLDHIAEFPDIARPRPRLQGSEGL